MSPPRNRPNAPGDNKTVNRFCPWPWLAAEFGEEGVISFTECLEGGDDYGHTLEMIVLVTDQLLKDAGRAMPDQGQFGGMAVCVTRALEVIARRDRHLRSRR